VKSRGQNKGSQGMLSEQQNSKHDKYLFLNIQYIDILLLYYRSSAIID